MSCKSVGNNSQTRVLYFHTKFGCGWMKDTSIDPCLALVRAAIYREPNIATEDLICCQKIQNLFPFKHDTLSFSCVSYEKQNTALNCSISSVESSLAFSEWVMWLCVVLWCFTFPKEISYMRSPCSTGFSYKNQNTFNDGCVNEFDRSNYYLMYVSNYPVYIEYIQFLLCQLVKLDKRTYTSQIKIIAIKKLQFWQFRKAKNYSIMLIYILLCTEF